MLFCACVCGAGQGASGWAGAGKVSAGMFASVIAGRKRPDGGGEGSCMFCGERLAAVFEFAEGAAVPIRLLGSTYGFGSHDAMGGRRGDSVERVEGAANGMGEGCSSSAAASPRSSSPTYESSSSWLLSRSLRASCWMLSISS